ncbi:MAG: hypothetical protein M3033_03740, partial [Acidobacteriota bacterium]|nr:hypothetical protein [Acidobacteriota bacterium]
DKPLKKHYIIVAETDGSGERIVATRDLPEFFELWGPAPAWSPDGEHLTVDAGSSGDDKSHLIEISLQTGAERELKTQIAWRYIERLAWANENELIVNAEEKAGDKQQLWSVRFPAGEATRITNDLNDYNGFNLTKDASKIVAEQTIQDFHLWLFDNETKTARQITFGENHSDGTIGLAFAPDNRIVFTAQDKNEYDIFSADMNGGDIRQLTKHAGRENLHAVVSPDNRFIAFGSDPTDKRGKRRLWLMNTDGTQPRQLTPTTNDEKIGEDEPYFSPDGKWIYYTRVGGERNRIWKISVDGGEPIEALHSDRDFSLPAVSPDGKSLAHTVFDDKSASPWSIGVSSLENGTEKIFNFPAYRGLTRWTPDSNSLVSINRESEVNDLWQTNIATGERKQITNFNAERIERFDISRDGRFFVVSRGNEFYDAVLIER